MKELSKTCPNCERAFVADRLNQIYCCRFCQIQKNNEKAKAGRSKRSVTQGVNEILWANREYLQELWETMEQPEEAFGVDLLSDDYFDTDYFTGYKSGEDGTRWYICYDFTYTLEPDAYSEVRKIQ